MKYKIRSEFSKLTEFILSLPATFDNTGSVIVNNRNIVKIVNTKEGKVVIKSFKGMYFLNRLVYSFLRKSKAERSYINASILNERGFLTPPNIGWLDCYNLGLLGESYYISGYTPYQTMRDVLDEHMDDESFKALLYHDLLAFIVKLHSRDVYHNDFSLRNILVIPTNGGYKFSLVDLNRVRFQQVSFRNGLGNFHKLEVPVDDLNNLIRGYAMQANQPPDKAVDMFWTDTDRTMFVRRLRKNLRKYTLTPVEKMLKGK